MQTAVLCERGQVTIPKPFRTRLGFHPSMILTFRISGNALVVEKQKKRNPFADACGCLATSKRTDDLIREMRGC